MRVWVVLAALLVAAGSGSTVRAAEAEQSPRARAGATISLDRPAGLPIRPIRLPRAPRLPPIHVPTVPLAPPVVVRPWRYHVDQLGDAQFFGEVQYLQARDAIRRLNRRDRYKRLMVDAFCTAMDWLAEKEELPSLAFTPAEWRAYFLGFFDYYWREHLRSYSRPYAVRTVDGWLDVWDMAEVNPSLAAGYLFACGVT